MMPSSKLCIVLVVVLFLGCAQCCSAVESGQISAPAKTVANTADQLDQETIMQMCNESFRTSLGSFNIQYSFSLGRILNLHEMHEFPFYHTQNISKNSTPLAHSPTKLIKHQW